MVDGNRFGTAPWPLWTVSGRLFDMDQVFD